MPRNLFHIKFVTSKGDLVKCPPGFNTGVMEDGSPDKRQYCQGQKYATNCRLNYIKPDFVHVLVDGKIVKTGNSNLAQILEKDGYEGVTATR